MAKAKFDIKDLTSHIPAEVTRPLYAGVGVTDLAVERVRGVVTDAHKRATGLRSDVEDRVGKAQKSLGDLEVKDLREQATRSVNSRVESLGKAAEQRQVAAEKRIASLQDEARAIPGRVTGFVTENLEAAGDTYADLAKRGETLVGRIRNQESTKQTASAAATTQAKAKTTVTQAKKTASATTTSAKSGSTSTAKTATTAAKSTTTSAKKAAGNTRSTAKGGATKTAKTAKTSARKTTSTAKKSAAPSSAKATATAAKKTASSAAKAAGDAAAKVGD